MDETKTTRFFLGANSAAGFYSLYDDFTDGEFLWIIKGGPGCGKSSFMRRIAHAAENAGLAIEYILCCGDPDSLDGIRIPAMRCAYVDGTAPHTLDTALPGAGELYLDLGAFYIPEALEPARQTLARLSGTCRAKYARAYELISAAELASPRRVPGLMDEGLLYAVDRRATSMARRLLPEGKMPSEQMRFLSGVTCQGYITLWETLESLCTRICTLDNDLGFAPLFLARMRAEALARGLAVVTCPDPLIPTMPEALLLPDAGLAFAAVTKERPFAGKVWRHLRLDAMANAESVRSRRAELRESAKLRTALLRAAVSSLSEAKQLHDEIEVIYNPAVDFAGVYELAERHIDYLLG